MTDDATRRRHRFQQIGLVMGPILALAVFLVLPEQYVSAAGETAALGTAGRATLAVMVWMATWWLTEAIDIAATALLPLVLFPLFGARTMSETAAPYASDLIYLFLGGFVLALSMQRWGLDRRIALVTLRLVGTRPPAVIGGFMAVTGVLSMWVSNTATAAMVLPIAQSVIRRLGSGGGTEASDRSFALALLLGIAYAASIGGLGTIIGSPPNGILVKFAEESLGRSVSFAQWLLFGVPMVAVFLPITWLLLTRVLFRVPSEEIPGGRALLDDELAKLGRTGPGEWITLGVFLVTATLWITRPWLAGLSLPSGAGPWRPLAGLTDSGIAMLAALSLFVIPAEPRTRTFTMDWRTAETLPWGVLVLFGGGLTLAAAVQANGVAELIGAQGLALRGLPAWVVVVAVTTAVIFLTELTSNTATTATLLPILAALAGGMALPAELLIFPAALAASCAFMMPVATPPNALVFATGDVTIPDMCRAGLWVNILGVVLIPLLMYALIVPAIGMSLTPAPAGAP
jgi:sodium-dependent dicarboxylate transporter 2/3/5